MKGSDGDEVNRIANRQKKDRQLPILIYHIKFGE